MALSQKLIQLVAAFLITLLLALAWYFVINPPPLVPLPPATETVETATQLLTNSPKPSVD